ncbi:MAG TPA: peptidylprolyl isomerase, partial [Ottowia sp.]|nr:peptidylprolyl isomerase [Ottowia sp.]
MHITQDTAVTLDYRITDLQGKPLDAGTTAYLHGGYDNLFAQAEAALQGKTVGDKVALALSAADA